MNVIMLLTNPCNPDVRVLKEAKYISEKGHQVTILCWDRDKNSTLLQNEKRDNIQLIRFRVESVYGSGYKQLGAFFQFVKCCKEYIKDKNVDIFHCHDFDGYISYCLLGMQGIPYVFDMHENYVRGNWLRKKAMYFLVKIGIRRSLYSLYVTEDVYKLYGEDERDKMLLLKNYPDSSYIENRDKTGSKVLRIGYHGTVRRQIPEFSALFEACNIYSNVRIDINGGGVDLPELVSMSEKYDNVYVHGPYDGFKDSNQLYENTDVLFCGYAPDNPNYQGDTEVVKFYEAIITGTPMLMTKGIGMGDKVEQMEIGMAVDTRSVKDLRRAVDIILHDEALVEKWRDNMKKIAANYQWCNAVKILDAIY